jgi:exodeoxyribonuclease V gamma subunit
VGEGAATVELGGATGLLVAGGDLALVPDPGGDGDRVRLLRYALRAWGDHLLLAAAGVGADRPRRALVLRKNGVSEIRLRPCSPAEARRRLTALAAELLAAPHPYLLPCEAVLGAWSPESGFGGDFAVRLSEKLAAAVDDPSKAGSSRFGAVTDLTPYPPPPLAAELARRRFAPVLELMEVAR